MKAKVRMTIMLLFVLTLVACEKQEERIAQVPTISNSKFIENSFIQFDKKVEPNGICVWRENIIVCKREQHCLGVYNKKGELIKNVGELGDGELEFIEPKCITINKEKIYILDAGNNTIKILDKNLKFLKKIKLDTLDHYQGGYRYIDMAVDRQERIYVSTNSVGANDAYIYFVTDSRIVKSKEAFVGYLTEYKGNVYAINSLELYRHKGKEGGMSGINYLYVLDGRKMKMLGELPYKICSADFCIMNDRIYLNSGAWNQLSSFNMEGELVDTIIEFRKKGIERYIMPIDKQTFLISDSINNSINIVCKKI